MRQFKIIEVNEINAGGKKFNAYKTLDKKGKKMDIRFIRACKNVPTEPCIISVEDDNCNVDTNRLYPVLWIKEVADIKPLERKNNVADFFDDITDDDMPF